jgi:hypothetical protein
MPKVSRSLRGVHNVGQDVNKHQLHHLVNTEDRVHRRVRGSCLS